MKIFLAFILSWFKGLGHSHAITEKKADAMQAVFEELGKDEGASRELAKTLLMKVHGYTNLVPAQMQVRANQMSRKIRKRNWKITFNEDEIRHLQRLIARDKSAITNFSIVKNAALGKKKAWS